MGLSFVVNIAISLQVLCLTLFDQLFDNLVKKLDVVLLKVQFEGALYNGGKLVLVITIFCANDYLFHEPLQSRIQVKCFLIDLTRDLYIILGFDTRDKLV